ncbi:MAG: GDP-mannose 4,6-dehydratase [Prevotella sp.]|jgi:nucleoside-diphosphate-sugar epimerase|nr:GDP-mannose 4,6-dehydratase [Prevotella sp.]
MSVLVTGCAGFIGSKVSEFLLQEGKQVVGVDNLNDYYDPKLKNYRLEQIKKQGGSFNFYMLDIENKTALMDIFKQHTFDVVYHLAARTGVRASLLDPMGYMQTNVLGVLNILGCMRNFSVKKLVFSSTSSLYAGQSMPFVETMSTDKPISPYAASKKAAEVMCYAYHHLCQLDVSVVRCFTVYGPYGRPDMSPDLFMKNIYYGTPLNLYGDGSQLRDFTYINDIARGILLASKPLGYEIINLGSEQPHTINEMIEIIERFLNKKAKINYLPFNGFDVKDTWASNARAKEVFGWRPEIDFENGLGKMVYAFLEY